MDAVCYHRSVLSRRHWIFDLDGTLTVAVHDFAAIRQALAIPDGEDILGFLDTLPPAEALPRIERLREIETELIGMTAAAEGALCLVSHLHGQGVKLGILTRNTREIAMQTLSAVGLDAYFREEWIFGRHDAPPKPAPEGIHRLAALWRAEADAMVMVGDYLFDLQTGRAAGVATVHVDPTEAFRWPDLTDVSLRSLADAMPFVAGTLEPTWGVSAVSPP